VVIATNERLFHLNLKAPELGDCPISLPELDQMFGTFGPRTTEPLGHAKIDYPAANKRGRSVSR
jgi:hypothetical protein